MTTLTHIHSLAAVEAATYTDLLKIAIVVVLLFLWAMAIQWVDRDTDVVKTKRQQWNLITVSGGFVAFLVLFVPPWVGAWAAVGFAFWTALAGGSLLAYVFHRNGRVVPAGRVLTKAHFKRLFGRDPNRRKADATKGIRVQITDHAGDFVEAPQDPDEGKDFDAMQDFLFDMLWSRASDVDMVAGKEKYRLVFRIDGVAAERPEGIPPVQGAGIIRCLKRVAGLNVEEIRRPQKGKIVAALLGHEGDGGHTDVHTSGTTAGERLRLHIRSGPVLMPLPDLGISEQRVKALKDIMGKGTGLMLLAAKPRNGLTTTQYAILKTHDAYIQNIHALERQPLMELDNITQRTYDGNSDVTFARMLQSVLRREPDVVLVSECEDRETAQIATKAAATDRKIYLGMHASDCFDAISKYISWVEENRIAAKALVGVMAQKLVRILCTECREAFRPDEATLKKLNLPADKIERFHRPPTEKKLDKKGNEITCQKCQGTGYNGRVGVFELMVVDEAVSKLIAEGASASKIKMQCRKNRMYYLQEEGLLKVIDGTTSMNEVLRSLRSNDS